MKLSMCNQANFFILNYLTMDMQVSFRGSSVKGINMYFYSFLLKLSQKKLTYLLSIYTLPCASISQ